MRSPGRLRQDPPLKVEAEVSHAEPARLNRGCRLAEAHSYARKQLRNGERLGQIVGRAELETAHLRADVTDRGENEDTLIGSALEQLLEHLEAVQSGEHQVQHDEVEAAGRGGREATVSAGLDRHVVAVSLEG